MMMMMMMMVVVVMLMMICVEHYSLNLSAIKLLCIVISKYFKFTYCLLIYCGSVLYASAQWSDE